MAISEVRRYVLQLGSPKATGATLVSAANKALSSMASVSLIEDSHGRNCLLQMSDGRYSAMRSLR
jgi:hypothetical protein